jgi:hypothetical protein
LQLIPHQFQKFELSEEEQRAGQALSLASKAVIHNLIVDAAEKKIGLTLDPLNINSYVQEEAYLRGQIDVLQYLLDLSAAQSS